jgi:hypothetical protein
VTYFPLCHRIIEKQATENLKYSLKNERTAQGHAKRSKLRKKEILDFYFEYFSFEFQILNSGGKE